MTDYASDVDLRRGLGEGKVGGAITNLEIILFEEVPKELAQSPLQIRQTDTPVNGQPLNLLKHRGMSGIYSFIAKHLAGHHYA